MKTRAALLARVSTLKISQDESPERQLERMRHFCASKEWNVAVERVERVSGGKAERDRPALAEIMELARAGKVDVVMATKMDRLGRDVYNMAALTKELHDLKVEIVLTDQDINTTTPAGRLQWNMISAIDQWQREDYAERAAAGKARAQARGIHCARPREPVQEIALMLIEQWHQSGCRYSWGTISRKLAELGYTQCARVIKYRGELRAERPWSRTTLQRQWQDFHARLGETLAQKPPMKPEPDSGANHGPVSPPEPPPK